MAVASPPPPQRAAARRISVPRRAAGPSSRSCSSSARRVRSTASSFLVLLEPIKHEFQVSDTQLGLLSGLSFALLYSAFGLPIARFADRGNRMELIAAAISVWSLMTVLCAAAASFWQLLLARIGVGVGEAGATPPAQSLDCRLFPDRAARPRDRHFRDIGNRRLSDRPVGGVTARRRLWLARNARRFRPAGAADRRARLVGTRRTAHAGRCRGCRAAAPRIFGHRSSASPESGRSC